MLANSINDILKINNENIIIIEYPNLESHNIPNHLLQESDINILVLRADKSWKETHEILLRKIKAQIKEPELQIYLNMVLIKVY